MAVTSVQPDVSRVFLEDLLDLINLLRAFPDVVSEEQISDWTEVAGCMLAWLEA